ncbi:MAG TPA: 3-phosphoshikimate 1-carboxyvinyltransferase [Vicinamibacterales bacterium]|nr:3-phosphoshikimate 1-carboxyvinyltransferase [Vicinamibacterales bacterium]
MAETRAGAVVVRPSPRAIGSLRVPGDKSISHRYAMLAALARGVSMLHGYAPGADAGATLSCLAALGVAIRRPPGGAVEVAGRGLAGLTAPRAPLDALNSGTTLRLLTGIAAAHPFRTVIGGDDSLNRRPMRRITEPLGRMGASIQSRDGRPPLTIEGARLRGIAHQTEIPSAQVKSAVLLAGLRAEGPTSVTEPTPTRDHTERALEAFGAIVEGGPQTVTVRGGQELEGRELQIPGDISSAAFWIALAAAVPGSSLEILDVGLNPTRTAFLAIVRQAGASVDTTIERTAAGEPSGRIHVAHGGLRSFSIGPDEVPGVIDEIPALAALAALMPPGESLEVRGAGELRVKESDRISVLAAGFRALGAEVEESPDGFRLTARPLAGAQVDPAGDHRLAMAFAIAATGARTPSAISGAAAAAVSYPGFFEELARLTSGEGR